MLLIDFFHLYVRELWVFMVYTYLWCFFLYAFLGWCCEVAYAAVLERRFVNRGFLNGPVCPIYGLGIVLIAFCMRPFRNSLAA